MMNEQDRSELGRIKERQAALEQEMILLARELRSLEQRTSQPIVAAAPPSETSPAPIIEPERVERAVETKPAPEPTPPIIVNLTPGPGNPQQDAPTAPTPEIHLPPPLPVSSPASTLPPEPPRIPQPAAGPSSRPNGSFEMRVGTFWLVRIGIVMLLTGLVFFGNYAYQNFIVHLNAGGKVALLYVASAILLGTGWRLQRKAAGQSIQNYAQVLFAGGLAALYFTTYAAHHFQNLKVIESPLLDGLLLLACAGFMVFMADLKKSEVLAVFAVLLAYYTSVITRVGSFTLYSNVVLTAASIFFLLRNRWVGLTFASLFATYLAYAFWRFLGDDGWHWASPSEGLWQGAWFLISYWVLFTAAVFLSRDQKLANENRAVFLSANNGAFFTLFLLTMLRVHHGGFWKFSIIYGSVLVALSLAARNRLPSEPVVKNSYLTQGLLLITIGLVTKYSGIHLALMLGAESVILLMLGQQSKNLVLLTGAYLTAGMAVGWGIDGMQLPDRPAITWGITLGLFMLADCFIAHRKSTATNAVRPGPAYFTILALIVFFVVTYDNVSRDHLPIVLAAEGLVLTISIHALRIPEITIFGQAFLVIAALAWLVQFAIPGGTPPWWNPAILLGELLFASHWWQLQKRLLLPSQSGKALQALYALALVGVVDFWVHPLISSPTWLAVTSLLALGLTAYGVFTRAWFIACCAQIFTALSVTQFIIQLAQDTSGWRLPLIPIGTLLLLSFATVQWFRVRPDSTGRFSSPLLQLAVIYRWLALLMSVWWICKYVPERERVWLLALFGLGLFLWSGSRSNREALAAGAVYSAVSLIMFWLPLTESQNVYWPNLVAIVVLLAQRQLARRFPERYPLEPGIHTAVIIIGGLSLWLFLTRWVLEMASGFYLTASWSVFALILFMAGMMLRERVYRWLGLAVLLCSLGRVVIFDVWKLETLYRILSFMALGIVLLVLGFIYNKYQEKIREWL